MAVKARTVEEKNHIKVAGKVKQKNYVTLHRIAASIGEDVDYTLDQIIEDYVAGDKAYRTWLEKNPEYPVKLPDTKGGKRHAVPARRPGVPPLARPA